MCSYILYFVYLIHKYDSIYFFSTLNKINMQIQKSTLLLQIPVHIPIHRDSASFDSLRPSTNFPRL